MSLQDPNRSTDLPSREAAENPTPMRDESRKGATADPDGSTGDGREPGRRRLGPAIAAVVLGLLSFVVGLELLSVAKTIAPAEGDGPAAQVAEPRKIDPMPPETDAPPNVKPEEPRDVILRLKGGDSRVELANTVGLLDSKGDFTVEMWARVNNPDGTQRFFGDRVARFKGALPSVYGGWECGPQFFDRAWGRLWVNVAGADRDVGGVAGGGYNVTPVWHHIAYVNAGNRCSVYIDGRGTSGTQTYQAPGPASSPIDLSIGASPEGDQRQFDGDVRAFRATSRARYTQRFVPPKKFQKDAGTVILLDFSGAGTRIQDLAGNHDGKIVNADWVPNAPPDLEQVPDKLTTPGLRLTGNSFIELAHTAGLLDGKEFCVEAWFKTPAFMGQDLHLFDDRVGGWGWGLHFEPKGGGEQKWLGKFAIGRKSWWDDNELEPLTIYHIAVVRKGGGVQIRFNGDPAGGALSWDIGPSTSNFFIGPNSAALPVAAPLLPDLEIHAFRASSHARYGSAGFIPQPRFDKDDDTLILLEFSGKGTTLKDLAGNHDGRITNATWMPGTR
jgi:hypothetical protein